MTKDFIIELKNRPEQIKIFLQEKTDVKSILFFLENLGHLGRDYNGDFLYELINHKNSQVRIFAIKNIGKLYNIDIQKLIQTIHSESDSLVRREIISAIGRKRSKENIDIFKLFLSDKDPKIVGQAIRALLPFKGDESVVKLLASFLNHPNEMIRNIIYKEFYASKDKSTDKLKHTETYDFLKNTIVLGDVLDVLKDVPDDSIHLTFTSPPYYNARDYSTYESYEAYLGFLNQVFQETHRITKEGRFLIVNTSPIIIPRISRSHSSKRYGIPFDLHGYLVKNGWEFVDDIVWMKPESSVKNRIGGFMQHRKPLGYKPNAITEYLMVYRKQTDKLLDWNIHSYSTSIVNDSKVDDGYETNNVWKIDPCFNKVHSAVFPLELCKRVIQYYSYKGDIIFDPFAGSGTLGRTAKLLDRLFFMTEQNEVYFEYMKSKQRISAEDIIPTKFVDALSFKNSIVGL